MLLVLDDLHVADAETLEFVADLAGWCRRDAVARRRGVPQRRAGAGGPRRRRCRGQRSRLVLGPLGHEDIADICRIYAARRLDGRATSSGSASSPTASPSSSTSRPATLGPGPDGAAGSSRPRAALAATRGRLLDLAGRDGRRCRGHPAAARAAPGPARRARGAAAGVAVAALAGCPYKGLARFEAADAANFFGRERLVAELVARVRETGWSPSSGRPAAASRRWCGPGCSRRWRPGSSPVASRGARSPCARGRTPPRAGARLRGACRRAAAPLVVFVDQFEETFTLGADADEQIAFIDRLLALGRRVRPRSSCSRSAPTTSAGAPHTPELADRSWRGNDVLVGPMRTASCGAPSSCRRNGPGSRSSLGSSRSSSATSPGGPARCRSCRRRWPRRGSGGGPAPHPRRLPGRGRRQRRPGPPGRGRLRRDPRSPPGPRPGGSSSGCAMPATTAAFDLRRRLPVGRRRRRRRPRRPGRARGARRPAPARRRRRHRRGGPRGAAPGVAAAAHLAGGGRRGPTAPPPPGRRRPGVGRRRARPVRALPRHPARRRERVGRRP